MSMVKLNKFLSKKWARGSLSNCKSGKYDLGYRFPLSKDDRKGCGHPSPLSLLIFLDLPMAEGPHEHYHSLGDFQLPNFA